ncbi:hypothetical protein [Halomontanus rarus]|uniref:hypothetical protein n=1 Tax=Halomontanus rarus TaxID=3034020 RepID=UPI00307B7516
MTDTAESAHDEWDYQHVENQFGNTSAVSIPCQLRFTDEPDQDTDRFHAALEDRGYSPLDHEPDRTMGGRRGDGSTPYYDGEVCSQEHYNRLKILVFRGAVVRLYPHDDYVPTADELTAVIDALEVGFDATLEHDPIERDA